MMPPTGDKISFPIRRYRPFVRAARALRKELTQEILETVGWTVQAGPFKGMRLSPDRSWGNDLVPQLFGYYEQQLFGALCAAQRGLFVDIGAADGYWAVGMVVSGHADRAIAFEARSEAREAIASLAALNGVADRVEIRGLADAQAMEHLRRENLGAARILVDIEGAEFELLDHAFLQATAGSILIVELHPWVAEAANPVEDLVSKAQPWFQTTQISDAVRDLSGLLTHVQMPDYLRGVLVSEERARPQNWLVFSPS